MSSVRDELKKLPNGEKVSLLSKILSEQDHKASTAVKEMDDRVVSALNNPDKAERILGLENALSEIDRKLSWKAYYIPNRDIEKVANKVFWFVNLVSAIPGGIIGATLGASVDPTRALFDPVIMSIVFGSGIGFALGAIAQGSLGFDWEMYPYVGDNKLELMYCQIAFKLGYKLTPQEKADIEMYRTMRVNVIEEINYELDSVTANEIENSPRAAELCRAFPSIGKQFAKNAARFKASTDSADHGNAKIVSGGTTPRAAGSRF
jgi:hypothetical protein